MNHVLIICGPTATGKTKLADRLAKRYDGELISADSRQVYRGMELTVGKERVDVPIWIYDVVDPDEQFSVSHWVKLARNAVSDIHQRNKLPIVVGGTGLYIKALLDPLTTIDIPPDDVLRKKQLSVSELQKMIPRGKMNDSDWNNPRRLIRKIEVDNFKRRPLASQGDALRNYDTLLVGLKAPLEVLDRRIDMRLLSRMDQGMQNEIDELRGKYTFDLPAMSAIGVNEKAYARRQMTWFTKQKGVHWFDVTGKGFEKKVEKLVRVWYTG